MENRYELNKQLAQMLKGGVIMDVTTPEQAKIAEAAGACAVMALERIPADIRAAGGVSRMSDPKMIQGFQNAIMPIRRELLTLRSYYDEIMDMGKQLEENENGFFAKKQVKYFGVISDRADRLMSKASQLLEYAQQVRDAYKAQVDAQQNNNMQFLTVISTIFFPLTLITGWFGMNFKDMPGLENGYPAVMALSIVIIVICILIFKKKKII